MENDKRILIEYLNAESKKNVDRANAILDLRRYLGTKTYSVCIVGEHDALYAAAIAHEGMPHISWLSNNTELDQYFERVNGYNRYDTDTLGCLDLFIKPHDIVIVSANVAINHPHPQRILSRFINMARIKAYVLNSHVAFDVSGVQYQAREILKDVEKINADKYTITRDVSRLNGWTELERKVPVTNKNFDIL
jgi:hypothetical protein